MRATFSEALAARRAKRGIDLLLGGLLFLAALPLIALCAGLVRIASPGPVLFRQRREGLGGTPFTMWKIRTMRTDADAALARHLSLHPENMAEWKRYRRLEHDPRVIPGIGRFLRRTSLDELPQLWNVVRGEMSLVGPRPLELEVVERLDPVHRRLRQTVRPGLTGLWQVSGRSELDLEEIQAVDATYLSQWTLLLDLRILARTPRAVASGRGAY